MSVSDIFNKAGTSRRGFMAGSAAVGAATALTGMGNKARAANRSGHLRIASDGGSSTDSLNPATYLSYVHSVQGYMFHNCLTEIGEGGKVIPELAESWEASADATVWKFNLRKGVTFHNGKEMTSEDVIWSLNQHRGADNKSGGAGYMQAVKDIKADGKHAIIVTVEAPNADIPYVMADYHFMIVPANTTDYEKGIGTGAYTLESFEPGVVCRGVKNANYWKADRGHADSVEVLSINDVASRTSALQTGEIHAMNGVDLKTVSLLKRNKNIQLLTSSADGHYPMPMRTDTAPYNNKDLRLALKYAMDRDELVKKILRGYGHAGNDHPISQSNPFYADDLPQRSFDPDKAAFHFKKSGYDGPVQLHASEAAFPSAIDAATLYRETASKAGIQIDIIREPSDGYWSNVWMNKPFSMSYTSGRSVPDLVFSLFYKSDAAWNDTFWKNDRFNELLLTARSELDFDKRKAMYVEMQHILHDDGGALIPLFYDFVDAASANVGGFIPGNFPLSGLRAAERLWVES